MESKSKISHSVPHQNPFNGVIYGFYSTLQSLAEFISEVVPGEHSTTGVGVEQNPSLALCEIGVDPPDVC